MAVRTELLSSAGGRWGRLSPPRSVYAWLIVIAPRAVTASPPIIIPNVMVGEKVVVDSSSAAAVNRIPDRVRTRPIKA